MLSHAVDVFDIRPYMSKSMVAFVDVRIDIFIIPGTKIMKRENGTLWVSFPSIERDGKYFEVVSIDSRSLEREIKGEIVLQYKGKNSSDNAFGNATPAQGFELPAEIPPDAF